MISYLDLLGAGFSLVATFFSTRAHWLTWPTSIVAILIEVSLFYQHKIYGDMSLQIIFLIMSLLGWYFWTHPNEDKEKCSIRYLNFQEILQLFIITVLSSALLSIGLYYYTDSDIPILDALTTCLSLVAQWLMCKKIIQTWHLWFIVDGLYIGLYAYKELPFHSLLLFVYLLLAIIGYRHWKKKANQHIHRPILSLRAC